MKKILLTLSFILFSFSSSQVLANHCSGGHDKATETSTTTSDDDKKKEDK